MAKIHIPAARVHQGGLVLYATTLKVSDLISENFYNVETLDPADDYLNETEDSPWLGKIKMANAVTENGTINQRSFVKAIVKYVLTANNPVSIIRDFDKEKRIFLNYWKAICLNLDDGDSETLYKYGGVELFCRFSIPFFMKLQDRGSFTVPTMEKLLKDCFENVDGDYAGVGHPDWWKTGGHAGRLNAGALGVVCQEMTKALHKVSAQAQVEI